MKVVNDATTTEPIDAIRPHPRNPRKGNISSIEQSITANGFYGTIIAQRSTGYILVGNHRYQAALSQNAKTIPVTWVDVEDEHALRILLADNRTNDLAGYDDNALSQLLQEIQDTTGTLEGTGYDNDDLDQLLHDLSADTIDSLNEKEQTKGDKPDRTLHIDAFFTISGRGPRCCIAIDAGLKYGTQSSKGVVTGATLCPLHETWDAHKLDFIDNDWREYDHALHTEAVARWKPKYATTLDLITKKQAEEAGAKWRNPDTILKWAEQLRQHAQNVILIPKFDMIDEIPEHFMLGYSVPTSHGGTPLPANKFIGRRVHLLGGSWAAQLQYMSILGDSVVSIDNNYVFKTAEFGQYTDPNGKQHAMPETIGFQPPNGLTLTLALSLSAIATGIQNLKKKDDHAN